MNALNANTEIQLHSGPHLVVGVNGGQLRLLNHITGQYSTMHIADLTAQLAEPIDRGTPQPRQLETLSAEEDRKIAFWVAHLNQLDTGRINPDDPDEPIHPDYDPALGLNQRIKNKIDELTELKEKADSNILSFGFTITVSRSDLLRKRKNLADYGRAGLIDGRNRRQEDPLGRADARIIETLREVIADEVNQSTGTGKRLQKRLKAKLLEAYPGVVIDVPSETTLYRYFNLLSKGKYTTGSAANRRSKANVPGVAFRTQRRMVPGEEVQIDSTPLDVYVDDGAGNLVRPTLTIMLDVATRSIIAHSLNVGAAKAVDHAYLLAQALTPRQIRPGHEERWQNTIARMPWTELISEEERALYDNTRVFIYPLTIRTDLGNDFNGTVFESAACKFGISLTRSNPGQPTDKSHVERAFHTIKTLFIQHLPGFTGGSVEARGAAPEKDNVMDVFTLDDRLDEWLTRVYQNRPHAGLTDPHRPNVTLTPNEAYRAMYPLTGKLRPPITRDDYIALLPIAERKITAQGIQLHNRVYNSPELQALRYIPSRKRKDGTTTDKFEVHYNPYDERIAWVKHPDGEWVEALWRDEGTDNQPHSTSIWSAARNLIAARPANFDPEHDDVLTDILDRAVKSGKASAKERARAAAQAELARKRGIEMPTKSYSSDELTRSTAAEESTTTTWIDPDSIELIPEEGL